MVPHSINMSKILMSYICQNEGIDKSLHSSDDGIKKSIEARKNKLHHQY